MLSLLHMIDQYVMTYNQSQFAIHSSVSYNTCFVKPWGLHWDLDTYFIMYTVSEHIHLQMGSRTANFLQLLLLSTNTCTETALA